MSDLEKYIARRADLSQQLRLMENHLADPKGNPSFGMHEGAEDTTEQNVATVKDQIAELDDLIAKMDSGNS
jgi:hypothetical protein